MDPEFTSRLQGATAKHRKHFRNIIYTYLGICAHATSSKVVEEEGSEIERTVTTVAGTTY
jgi:hypothetical protein